MQWKGVRSVMLSSRGRGRSMHIDLQNGGCYATKIDAPVHSGGKVNETMTGVPSTFADLHQQPEPVGPPHARPRKGGRVMRRSMTAASPHRCRRAPARKPLR